MLAAERRERLEAITVTTRPVQEDESEGRWRVQEGQPHPVETAIEPWRDGAVEDLTYSNPFGQELERVWFDGKVVYAAELGELDVDPATTKVAQEYQLVYAVELDDKGKLRSDPERVPDQYNIYDSVPGMDGYSPLWQFNYVIVPREHEPNSLRSEDDCLHSGYRIVKSTIVEN